MEIGDRLADSLPDRYEPDILLPVQYYELTKRGPVLDGERRLMFAVLEDAIECYLKNMGAGSRKRRLLFYAARDWINARDKMGIFAYETLCEELDIDPEVLRETLERFRRRGSYARKPRRTGQAAPVGVAVRKPQTAGEGRPQP